MTDALLGGRRPDTSDAWVISYNFHQYLWVEPGQDTRNQGFDANTPLLKGVGIFGRFSYSDGDVNPNTALFSAGVSGRGLVPTRDDDTFGIGAFYGRVSQHASDLSPGFRDGYWGFEFYYDVRVTSWFHVSPDLQVQRPFLDGVGTTTILGLRARLDL